MKASKTTYGIAAALGAASAIFVVFVVLRPTDRDVSTPYADFERDLAAGKISMLEIDGTTYRYRAGDTPRKTTGPKATLGSIAAMRSADKVGPKVTFKP